MRKYLYAAIILSGLLISFTSSKAADLNLVLDVTYAQDHKESAEEAIIGLELYSKTYGSITVGLGYESQKVDFFGEINEKQNQGLYIRYQGMKKIASF